MIELLRPATAVEYNGRGFVLPRRYDPFRMRKRGMGKQNPNNLAVPGFPWCGRDRDALCSLFTVKCQDPGQCMLPAKLLTQNIGAFVAAFHDSDSLGFLRRKSSTIGVKLGGS
jgi:hypothetical protein